MFTRDGGSGCGVGGGVDGRVSDDGVVMAGRGFGSTGGGGDAGG